MNNPVFNFIEDRQFGPILQSMGFHFELDTIHCDDLDAEQTDAAKTKALAFSAANPDKLVPIGKPSSTKDGLRVEFGVLQ